VGFTVPELEYGTVSISVVVVVVVVGWYWSVGHKQSGTVFS
jgi:hypothetical protein